VRTLGARVRASFGRGGTPVPLVVVSAVGAAGRAEEDARAVARLEARAEAARLAAARVPLYVEFRALAAELHKRPRGWTGGQHD
jgi:hypothetical protein